MKKHEKDSTINEYTDKIIARWTDHYDKSEKYSQAKTIGFCDVTLRDGQQQRAEELSTSQRIDIFDAIVATGVNRIEIGHLGNPADQHFAVELIKHIADKEQVDDRYRDLKIQVLFGSQKDIIDNGCSILTEAYKDTYGIDWRLAMEDKTIVHVYDRLDPNLRNTSSQPYSDAEAADKVSAAAKNATEHGFTHFSISGEAATAVIPETAIDYYRSITKKLFKYGAQDVNVNLANTYGYSQNSMWNAKTLAIFNRAVKHGFGGKVTTSIHSHNDVNSSTEFTMAALVGGFNIVESTHVGMGERSGNVAAVDVMSRIIEQAIHDTKHKKNKLFEKSSISKVAANFMLSKTISIDPKIVENLHNWYSSGQYIAESFGQDAIYRWRRTTLGSDYSHDNGSGPHDQAMFKTIESPVDHPADSHYEWNLMTNNILGRPGTEEIAVGNPAWVDKVTVGNHAGGGKTKAIKEGKLIQPQDEVISEATYQFNKRKRKIISKLLGGVTIHV